MVFWNLLNHSHCKALAVDNASHQAKLVPFVQIPQLTQCNTLQELRIYYAVNRCKYKGKIYWSLSAKDDEGDISLLHYYFRDDDTPEILEEFKKQFEVETYLTLF